MMNQEPEVIAEVERLEMEMSELCHKLETTSDEQDRIALDTHLKHVKDQIADLRRHLPN